MDDESIFHIVELDVDFLVALLDTYSFQPYVSMDQLFLMQIIDHVQKFEQDTKHKVLGILYRGVFFTAIDVIDDRLPVWH